MGNSAVEVEARLLRHDRLIVVSEVRSAFSSWTDRLIAFAVISVALVALRATLFPHSFIAAATAVAVFAAAIGAGTARVIERRLDFHSYDGVIAGDALARGARRHYILSIHAMACGAVAICALIGRPVTGGLAVIGYAVGAGCSHIARRVLLDRGSPRRPAPLRSVRRFLQRPIAGALAAIPVVLPLLVFRSVEAGPMAALIGLVGAVAALSLTMLDDRAVRFMTESGYRPGRIVGIHSRSLLVFVLLTVSVSLTLSNNLIAVVIVGVVLMALVVITARILAYRVHSKRTADTLVSICAAVAGLAGFAMPMLLPLVVIAILWHLHRRSVSATWLLM